MVCGRATVWRPPRLRQGRGRPWGLQRPLSVSAGGRPLTGRYKVSPVGVSVGEHRPNKRLKLAGALALKEAVVSCPRGHGTFVHYSCAGGRVARSLSAIR